MSDAPLREGVSLESLVAEVADEFLARRNSGEKPDVAEYVQRYPQYAAVLSQVLSSLALVELASGPGPFATDPAADVPRAGLLGDFRILREVGRGGMGVVYEARQLSLDRRVALKVLPFAAALDPKQLRRFKNEAQAAAQLHHSNIVSVFGVGCERGVHFFAMQFIEGRTLADVIGEMRPAPIAAGPESLAPRPPDAAPAVPVLAPDTLPGAGLPTDRSTRRPEFFGTIARLGLQAAEALEHAHLEGIVHRDVKPANLLVDVKGNLWVTDFGLARLRDRAGFTLSGDLVGTLRYMSPEQALGFHARVDHRTDVYALGATLYELLVARPVFEGNDRQQLLRRIASEEPRPPRKLNPAVPAELETIVLKALEKEAEARYATARDLADDLHRYLEYKPIRARRNSWLERARKWARRHRPVVWVAAVTLSVFAAVLAAGGGWALRDKAARQAKADADLAAVVKEVQDFQRDGKWPQAQAAAMRARDLLLDGTAGPSAAERAQDLLRALDEEADDRRVVARLEESRFLQAEVHAKENRFLLEERVRPDYRQAFRDYGLSFEATVPAAVAGRLRGRPAAVRNILLAAIDHWLILARHEKAPEADWLEQVLSAADSDPWRQRVRSARRRNDRKTLEQLARDVDVATQPPETLLTLNYSLRQRGAGQTADALLRRAREAFPGDFWFNYELGIALQQCRPPQPDEAIRFLTSAGALRPDNAPAHLGLGRALLQEARFDDAAIAIRRAIGVRPEYAAAHFWLGMVLRDQRRFDDAAASFRRAGELNPDDPAAHLELGNILRQQGRLDDATACFRRAIEVNPEYPEAYCNLGLALQSQGMFAEALAALKRGHELGVQRPTWRYESARWVKDCQRLSELDGRLPAVLVGQARPAGTAEALGFARVCYFRKRYAAAARLMADAFAAEPASADDVAAGYRYSAACMAALAGCDGGADAGRLSGEERARWRQQALEWLRAELQTYGKLLESGKPEDGQRVLRSLRRWQTDPDLAGLRDPPAVAELPAPEQRACERLRAEVAALLARAGAADPAAAEARRPKPDNPE